MRRRIDRMAIVMGLVAVGLAAPALTGCTSRSASGRLAIYGTVTINGEPVEQGSLSLLPTGGRKGPAANTVIAKGKYRFSWADGPRPGRHKAIVSVRPGGGSKAIKAGTARKGDLPHGPVQRSTVVTIPQTGSRRLDLELP